MRHATACNLLTLSLLGSASSVAAVTSNLLFVPTTRQVPDTDGGPTEVAHHPGKAAARARSPTALEHLQMVEQSLRANSLDAIVADLASHAFQA